VRQARPDDHALVDAINRVAWAGGYTVAEHMQRRHGPIDGKEWPKEITDSVAAALQRDDVTLFVAELNQQVVGYATAQYRDGADVGEVGYNAVHPDYRGRGIGSALVEHVVRCLQERGARVLRVITLDSDEPARRIYRKLGFKTLAKLVFLTRQAVLSEE
jgi:ribosomal-protein-alanine N-acetyltransferase